MTIKYLLKDKYIYTCFLLQKLKFSLFYEVSST